MTTVNADGTISFGDFASNSLLAIETINKLAEKMLTESRKRAEEFDRWNKIRELRASCGVENPPIRIRMYPTYGEVSEQA